MVNKRGIIRIVEAVVAIMIILGVMLIISEKKTEKNTNELYGFISPLLEEIAQNLSMREKIIQEKENAIPEIMEFISERAKNTNLDYSVRICGLSEQCGLEKYPSQKGDVYALDRVISSTISNFAPVKVRIFAWVKE